LFAVYGVNQRRLTAGASEALKFKANIRDLVKWIDRAESRQMMILTGQSLTVYLAAIFIPRSFVARSANSRKPPSQSRIVVAAGRSGGCVAEGTFFGMTSNCSSSHDSSGVRR
jgi:hypothetical protein